MTYVCRSKSRNLALGVIEAGSTSLLAAIVVGATMADYGQSNVSTAIATALPFGIGVYVVVTRYLPMHVTLDTAKNAIEFRNTWRSGTFRWSDVEEFWTDTGFHRIRHHERDASQSDEGQAS